MTCVACDTNKLCSLLFILFFLPQIFFHSMICSLFSCGWTILRIIIIVAVYLNTSLIHGHASSTVFDVKCICQRRYLSPLEVLVAAKGIVTEKSCESFLHCS